MKDSKKNGVLSPTGRKTSIKESDYSRSKKKKREGKHSNRSNTRAPKVNLNSDLIQLKFEYNKNK